MSVHIVVPHAIDESNLTEATSQGGPRISGSLQAGVTNVGDLTCTLSGAPSADLLDKFVVVDAGNPATATFKYSQNAGGTYLGRKVDTTWDGDGSAEIVMRAAAADLDSQPSNVIGYDSDDDGIVDCLLVGCGLKIYRTTDLTGKTGWAAYGDAYTDATWVAQRIVSLVVKGSDIFAAVVSNYAPFPTWWYNDVQKSTNGGVTFAVTAHNGIFVGSIAAAGNMILLGSGKLFMVYTYNGTVAYGTTSADGVTWSAPIDITGYNTTGHPWAMQTNDMVTHIFVTKASDGLIYERITANADPGAGGWGNGTDTLWAAAAEQVQPCCCVGTDGTKYVAFRHTTSDKIQYTKLLGAGTYAAVATLLDIGDALAYPAISCIGGQMFAAYQNTTDLDANLVITKYWTAYSANPSWTSNTPQYLHDGMWVTWGGAAGVADDYFECETVYDYGAARMFVGYPRRPTRSAVDNADWVAVYDAGASRLFVIDTILAIAANIEHLHVQMNETDSWGSPSVNTVLSFVRSTIASANLSLSGCELTLTSGTLTPHSLRGGHRLRFATSGEVFAISDNSALKIWCDGNDISAGSGDAQILSSNAWTTQTLSGYRWLRVLIEDQDTAEGYYQIGALVLGIRTALASHHKASRMRTVRPGADQASQGGTLIRRNYGPARRAWQLAMTKPSTVEEQEVLRQLLNLTAAPVGFVPDTDNSVDCAVALLGLSSDWNAYSAALTIEEVV